MGDGLTPMEREAIERRRNGETVGAVEEKTPQGAPIVSLQNTVVEPPKEATPTEDGAQQPANVGDMASLSMADLQRMGGADLDSEPEEEPAAETEPEVDEPIAEGAPTHCQYCGWDLNESVDVEPTEADKEEFIKSVLGERRFERVVEFLGGKVKIQYHTPTVAEEDAMLQQMRTEEAIGNLTNNEQWWNCLRRFRALCMLRRIELDGKIAHEYDYISMDGDAPIKEAEEERFKRIPSHLLSFIVQGMSHVDGIYGQLITRAQNPDFWTGPSA
jgi:hypothetical protein